MIKYFKKINQTFFKIKLPAEIKNYIENVYVIRKQTLLKLLESHYSTDDDVPCTIPSLCTV